MCLSGESERASSSTGHFDWTRALRISGVVLGGSPASNTELTEQWRRRERQNIPQEVMSNGNGHASEGNFARKEVFMRREEWTKPFFQAGRCSLLELTILRKPYSAKPCKLRSHEVHTKYRVSNPSSCWDLAMIYSEHLCGRIIFKSANLFSTVWGNVRSIRYRVPNRILARNADLAGPFVLYK